MATSTVHVENNLIRTMVRSGYDLQKVRVQMGNRITGNFKAKLGFKNDGVMSEADLEKEAKKVLETLRESYMRITDGVVKDLGKKKNADDSIKEVFTESEEEPAEKRKLPTKKKFIGDEIISTYTELILVDQYMTLLRSEEKQFKGLEKILSDIPIYNSFLSKIAGVGNQMAGVILSEIDIHKAQYPSSIWKYAGLDVVTVGEYTDDAGKTHIVPAEALEVYYSDGNFNKPAFLAEGKYPVTFIDHGRSRKSFCLVSRDYTDREGEIKTKNSITFNPFLKTKLIGVLGSSFLRAGSATVDGVRCGAAARLKMAKAEGFDPTGADAGENDILAQEYLRSKGHVVEIKPSPYGRIYYDYKARLDHSPHHDEKTKGHKHAMAIRYAVKIFLEDLYNAWREIEGLPVAETYAKAKLGLEHGVATHNKFSAYQNVPAWK